MILKFLSLATLSLSQLVGITAAPLELVVLPNIQVVLPNRQILQRNKDVRIKRATGKQRKQKSRLRSETIITFISKDSSLFKDFHTIQWDPNEEARKEAIQRITEIVNPRGLLTIKLHPPHVNADSGYASWVFQGGSESQLLETIENLKKTGLFEQVYKGRHASAQ